MLCDFLQFCLFEKSFPMFFSEKWANPGLFFWFIFVFLHIQNSRYLFKHRWCTVDSNLGQQDGRCRWTHWAMVAPQVFLGLVQVLKTVKIWQKWSSSTFWYTIQCDQIWQNFTTLSKVYKSLANFWQFISYLAKYWAYFGKFVTLLG